MPNYIGLCSNFGNSPYVSLFRGYRGISYREIGKSEKARLWHLQNGIAFFEMKL